MRLGSAESPPLASIGSVPLTVVEPVVGRDGDVVGLGVAHDRRPLPALGVLVAATLVALCARLGGARLAHWTFLGLVFGNARRAVPSAQ